MSKLTSTNHSIWSKLIAFKHFIPPIRHGCRLYFNERFGAVSRWSSEGFSCNNLQQQFGWGSLGSFFPQGDWKIRRMVRMTVYILKNQLTHLCFPGTQGALWGELWRFAYSNYTPTAHLSMCGWNYQPPEVRHKISLVHKRQCSCCRGRCC